MARLNAKELDNAHRELKVEARQRIAERGILQFRADPETVKAVLQAADEQNMPVGAILRQWIQEKLILEVSKKKAPDLVQRVISLEAAITKLQKKFAK
jgi:hypothetical protein